MANALAVAGPNSRFQAQGAKPAGFWAGLWHGAIYPITFIIGLFLPGVRMHEAKDSGTWYNLGFLIGVFAIYGETGPRIRREP